MIAEYIFGKVEPVEKQGLRRALRLILNHRKVVSLLVISSMGAALFEGGTMGILGLAVAVLVGDDDPSQSQFGGITELFFDQYFTGLSKGGLFLLLVGAAIFAQVIKSVLLFISNALEIFLSIQITRRMQSDVVNKMMRMTYPAISQHPAGSLASYLEQSLVVKSVLNIFSNTTRAILMFVVYGVLVFWISPTMALISVVTVFFVWLAVGSVSRKLLHLSKRVAQRKVFLSQWTVEYLSAARLLRVFNSEKHAADRINKARDEVLIPERKSLIIAAAVRPAMEIVSILGAGGFLIFGYWAAGGNAAEAVPGLLVLVLIFYRVKPHIQTLADLRTKISLLLPSLNLVEKIFNEDEKPMVDTAAHCYRGFKSEIEFSNVSFKYPGSDQLALDHVSFKIRHGATVALVGSSGAGKSTIADLLLALSSPTRGSIVVDGRDLTTIDPSEWRNHIGVVDQDVFLLNASVLENVAFARIDASREEIIEACRAANAHDFIEEFESGYDTNIGERGFRLSGGQKQRIALARALVRDPDLLILDEATSALDSISERQIQDALERMQKSRTLFVIAHRLSTIERAEHVLVLESGKLVEQGTPKELRSIEGRFSKMWDIQTRIG